MQKAERYLIGSRIIILRQVSQRRPTQYGHHSFVLSSRLGNIIYNNSGLDRNVDLYANIGLGVFGGNKTKIE